MRKILFYLILCLAGLPGWAIDLYVIGDIVNGESWLLKDPNAKMAQVSNGVYQWSGSVLGSEFKINDGTWSNPNYNIGSNGNYIELGVEYAYVTPTDDNISFQDSRNILNPKVEINFNTGKILVEGQVDTTQHETAFYIVGSNIDGTQWSLANPKLKFNKVDEGLYEWSGKYICEEFKINDGKWSNKGVDIGSNGDLIRVGEPYQYIEHTVDNILIENYIFDPKVTLDINNGTVTIDGEEVMESQFYYFLIGDFGDENGSDNVIRMEKVGKYYMAKNLHFSSAADGKESEIAIASSYNIYSWGLSPTGAIKAITSENMSAPVSKCKGGAAKIPYTLHGDYDVYWDKESIIFVKAGEEGPGSGNVGDLYIIGSNINGNTWQLSDPTARFSYKGKGRYEWRGTFMESGFKINDGTWNNLKAPDHSDLILNFGSTGDELELGKPYSFLADPGASNIRIANVTEVLNPLVVVDIPNRTVTVTADGNTLDVNLPEDAGDGRYKNCIIELTENTSGSRQRYVVTDRLVYTFQGLSSSGTYTVRLLTPGNTELGSIESFEMAGHDIEISFQDIKTLYGVTAKVLTPEGNDITDNITIEWFTTDADGKMKYLKKAACIGELAEGESVICRATLDEKYGKLYTQPRDVKYTVAGGTNVCSISLATLPAVTLSGNVTDSDGNAIKDATVTVSQTLNGRFSKTYSTKTSTKGEWTLAISKSPSKIIYSAQDCVNLTDSINTFADDETNRDLGKIKLMSIVGARISYSFTYREAGDDEASDYYKDYNNVSIDVFDLSHKRAIENISVQYPLVAILDTDVASGDSMRLTAKSKNGAFAPIETTVTIGDNLQASAVFNIIGKGGISADYEMTENPEVLAMLYTAGGELLTTQQYADATAKFSGLDDGHYTLISMGRSDLMGSMQRLAGFAEAGLKAGTDYVSDEVDVAQGKISTIHNELIPTFDESLLYYTGIRTGFSTNKASIITGNYLTFRSNIDFKQAFAEEVENVSLVVDLPSECDFVGQSVIRNQKALPYTLDGHRLTVDLSDDYSSQVRFCAIPLCKGIFNATAYARFNYKGKTVMQPIGTATSMVEDISIVAPKATRFATFNVSGMAPANSEIQVYEGDAVIGTGKATSTGSWSIECSLDKPYNLSTHSIYAKIATASGSTMISETKNVSYDINCIQVSKVTMYHWNPEMHKTFVAEFDFIHPKSTPTHWSLYFPKKVFTYTIEFTENNPDKISNVVLYVHTADGKFVPVKAHYDTSKKLWYAEIEMGSTSGGYYPVNCSVDFDYNSDLLGDSEFINNSISEYDEELEEDETIKNLIADILNTEYSSQTSFDELLRYLNIEEEKATVPDDLTTFWNDILQEESETNYSFKNGQLLYNDENGNLECLTLLYTHNKIVSDAELEKYVPIDLTNGSTLYLFSDGEIVYIYHEGTFSAIGTNSHATNNSVKATNRINSDEFFTKWNQAKSTLDALTNIKKVRQIINKITSYLTPGLTRRKAQLASCKKISAAYVYNTLPPEQLEHLDFKKLRDCLERLPKEIRQIEDVLGRLKSLCKIIEIASIINDINYAIDSRREWNVIIENIKSIDCPNMDTLASRAIDYRNRTSRGYDFNIKLSIASCSGLDKVLGMLATVAIATKVGADISMATVSQIASIVAMLVSDVQLIQGGVNQTNDIRWKSEICNAIPIVKCEKDCGKPDMPPCPDPDPNGGNKPGGGQHQSGNPGNNVEHDPSGYVYEAVPDNRIEGVQASIYYKETKEDMYGDLHDEIVLWNAEEYAQKNPLFTDENGMYRWDVPQGLWQVKFEKDGYETAFSEWLPVPPPQLDVNIALTQSKQPEVTEARAYETGVEIQFDKYMDLATLTDENIYITANGKYVPGEISFVDKSDADGASNSSYASRVRFTPYTPLSATTGEVVLNVNRRARSYAGIPMRESFSQVLDVEKEVQMIHAENTKVIYGEEKEITVYAVPAEAAAGRTLRVVSSSDLIAKTDAENITLDSDGEAIIKVKGELPGSAQLTFTIDDVKTIGECDIDVVTAIIAAEAPRASRPTGTAVYRGTKIELASTTPGATIYFTTDGTCPCDEDGSRRKYTVPVVITDDTHILAMAKVDGEGGEESPISEFNYTIKHNILDFNLPQGWSWVSHSFDESIHVDTFIALQQIVQVKGQKEELVKDDTGATSGTLDGLDGEQSYRIMASEQVSVEHYEAVARHPRKPFTLTSGPNWIAYPAGQAMTVNEAFCTASAEPLDVIVGQHGFAQYDGERWIGTLETMSPGLGYIYHSRSPKTIAYNTSIVSKAAARSVKGIKKNAAGAIDIHKYPSVMPIIATITDVNNTSLDNNDYIVEAYSNNERRGIGKNVDGLVMMSVYGQTGDNITLVATDKNGLTYQLSHPDIAFDENVHGSLTSPYVLTIKGTTTNVNSIGASDNISASFAECILSINGVAPADITGIAIYDADGASVFTLNQTESLNVKIPKLISGVYLVVIEAARKQTVLKVAAH